MNSEIATFKLSLFDEFIKSYKSINSLVSEVSEAFDQFLPALDRFFDLYEKLTENKMRNRDILMKWYKSAIVSN
ncbi:10950_t:CDS:1, partial [Funneliformis mosseae]